MTREALSQMVELLRDTAKLHQPNEEILTDVKAESFIFVMDSVLSALSEDKGEWIRFKNFEEGYFHIKCSKCGQYWSIDDHAKIFKYCFNCGADMRGEK